MSDAEPPPPGAGPLPPDAGPPPPDAGPPPPDAEPPAYLPDWYDLHWYPPGYERNQLQIDEDELFLHPVFTWAGPGFNDTEHQNEPWRQLAGVVSHAETVHRFTDNRWIPFQGKPLPDGSNVGVKITLADGTRVLNGSRESSLTFHAYRQWLELLYLNSLLNVILNPRDDQGVLSLSVASDWNITQHLGHNLPGLINDIKNFEGRLVSDLDDKFQQFDSDERLNWILPWRRSAINTLHDMLAASKWAVEEEEEEGGEVQFSMLQEFSAFSYIHQVLVALVYKEESFEERLRFVHVEDEHIVKRIRLIPTEVTAVMGKSAVRSLYERFLETVLNHTRDLQESFRELFSFRQLREWGYGRPWRKLHLIFDTEARPRYKDAVKSVREMVTSNPRAAELFGAHPAEKSDMKADCVICMEDWKHEELAIETHCNHYFHPRCIVRYWDDYHSYDFRCPLCRTSAGRVRDRIVFNAHKQDFVPDAGEAATQNSLLREWNRALREHPGFLPEATTLDYRMAVGMHMEERRLQNTLRSEGEIIPPLP